jgi:hypothetical protein
MKTQPIHISSARRNPEAGTAPSADSRDRPDRTRRAPAVSGARILRRWSVTDLIARAGGAPRAFA